LWDFLGISISIYRQNFQTIGCKVHSTYVELYLKLGPL